MIGSRCFSDSSLQDTFLQINDQINTVLNRYEAFKKGDYVTASNPIPAELGPGASGLSLIDLDESTPPTTNTSGPDDLVGLFTTSGSTASTTMPTMAPVPLAPYTPQMPYGMGNGMAMGSLTGGVPRSSISPPQVSNTPPAIMLPGTPVQNPSLPNYFGNNMNVAKGPVPVASGMGRGPNMFSPATQAQQSLQPGGIGRGSATSSLATQTQQPPQPDTGATSGSSQTQGKDPFADLVGLF